MGGFSFPEGESGPEESEAKFQLSNEMALS